MISPDAEEHLFHSYVAKHEFDFMGKRLAEWSNLNLLDMIPKVTGAITLRPAHFDKVERYLYYMPGVSYSQVFFGFRFHRLVFVAGQSRGMDGANQFSARDDRRTTARVHGRRKIHGRHDDEQLRTVRSRLPAGIGTRARHRFQSNDVRAAQCSFQTEPRRSGRGRG